MNGRAVWVRGLEAVTAAGVGGEGLRDQLLGGKSAVRPVADSAAHPPDAAPVSEWRGGTAARPECCVVPRPGRKRWSPPPIWWTPT
jgi:hypothetical protein